MEDKIIKSNEEWKKELTPEQYSILRERGTEAPFTGIYHDSKEKGMYKCAACGNELFSSDTKFDSGTGWPSFTGAGSNKNVELKPDDSLGMKRVEVICAKCGSHLGHVFDDGPKILPDGKPATGKRFCINSCSLNLDKKP